MIGRIKRIFGIGGDTPQEREGAVALAVAALMVELMRTDGRVDEAEQRQIVTALGRHFGLSDHDTGLLMRQAEEEIANAHDIYQFTRLIKARYDRQERIGVLKELWRIALADGHIDPYEEHLIRKIAELLGIYHSEFIASKLAARSD